MVLVVSFKVLIQYLFLSFPIGEIGSIIHAFLYLTPHLDLQTIGVHCRKASQLWPVRIARLKQLKLGRFPWCDFHYIGASCILLLRKEARGYAFYRRVRSNQNPFDYLDWFRADPREMLIHTQGLSFLQNKNEVQWLAALVGEKAVYETVTF